MFNALWESLKTRSARLRAADQTDDQTHTHHAMITVLFFGALGFALLSWKLDVGSALRVGYIVGVTFYILREVIVRLRHPAKFYYKPWDGALDILEPMVWSFPVVFASPQMLYVLAACYAVLYFALRPITPTTEEVFAQGFVEGAYHHDLAGTVDLLPRAKREAKLYVGGLKSRHG